MTDECEHGSPLHACPVCDRPRGGRRATEAPRHAVEAAYDGLCPACDLVIVTGDGIVYVELDGGWVHQECAR